jgi:hypothetical protein
MLVGIVMNSLHIDKEEVRKNKQRVIEVEAARVNRQEHEKKKEKSSF